MEFTYIGSDATVINYTNVTFRNMRTGSLIKIYKAEDYFYLTNSLFENCSITSIDGLIDMFENSD